jgi:RimJ/RimL family protein N-acetyltransferase
MIEDHASLKIETERLILRNWRESDREPWAAMNADPRVREFFPALLTRDQSDGWIASFMAWQARDGFTFWAVEEKASGALAGFTGLTRVDFEAAFAPAVEIGWRLAHRFWGRGYATEAARACLDYGFNALGLPEIVSFAVVANVRSRRVMERIGMIRDPAGDFDHPRLPAGHPLRRHAFYRLANPPKSAAKETSS